ncbi:hypothetical protein D3C87_1388230 [compost metagenome]
MLQYAQYMLQEYLQKIVRLHRPVDAACRQNHCSVIWEPAGYNKVDYSAAVIVPGLPYHHGPGLRLRHSCGPFSVHNDPATGWPD